MRCSNCQIDVVAGAAFCNHCGIRIQKLCNNCYTSNPAESRFCRSCGGSLSSEPEATTPEPSVSSVASPRGQGIAQGGITTCPRCSKVNEPRSAYCFSCGLPLEKDFTSHAKEGDSSVPLSLSRLPNEPAGFWIRLAAYLIDSILLMIVTIILLIFAGSPPESWGPSGALEGVGGLLGLIYFTFAISGWSATIGKHLMGLCVLRSDGSRVGPGRALARYFAYIPSSIFLLIGFIMIGLRKDKRGLHDLICDTVVVRR